MDDTGLIVVVPHSGMVIPAEIPLSSLAENFPLLTRNMDWHTDWLYDFRDMIGNRHLVFPYCCLVLEANRHPEDPDESVPLRDVNGRPVYRPGHEPSRQVRKAMAAKYLARFHKKISGEIAAGATFLFDGHSTVTARGVAANQIDLMNFQHSPRDEEPLRYCPDIFIETYAAELRRQLPDIKITVNASEYYKVYGHVCAAHAVNAMTRIGQRVPALLQETNQQLYMNADNTPNAAAINRLRRAFGEALTHVLRLLPHEKKDNDVL